jgi:hypothetical protein
LSPKVLEAFEKAVFLDITEELEEVDGNAVLHDLLAKPIGMVNSKPKFKA